MKVYHRDTDLKRIKYEIDSLNKGIEYIISEYGIFNPNTGNKVHHPKYVGDIPYKFLDSYKFKLDEHLRNDSWLYNMEEK